MHKKKYHFIGIGGIGMSGLAEVLLNLGHQVCGSDAKLTPLTQRLQGLGAKIFEGHAASHVPKDTDIVVISSAIHSDNPELICAKEYRLPILTRGQLLADLSKSKKSIVVGGAHGKTTTSSLVAMILESAGFDPTAIIGGRVRGLGSNAKLGHGDYLVAEADESDGSFLRLSPLHAIVTNIDFEHADFYKDLPHIKRAFTDFLLKVSPEGSVIVCSEDKNIRDILPNVQRKIIRYGLSLENDYRATHLSFSESSTEFDCEFQGRKLARIKTPLSGEHNVLNCLAAIAAARELNISISDIQKALLEFSGVERRFHRKGEKNNVLVLDDYGHHPSEIQATLSACKRCWPNRRLITVFQPHRYTRTKALFSEFVKCFRETNLLILTDIYAASESPISGVSAEKLAAQIRKQGVEVFYEALLSKIPILLKTMVKPGDVLLTLGAGNIFTVGEKFLEND
ncbi:MAG: UDP-N-acetylmuramate--L-alanine ligase [Deltaproteobacteria bacterium]|nr:UDP-N-acetylmuramate--L-alanine ligase [Deltaproteobacteria bacterium]